MWAKAAAAAAAAAFAAFLAVAAAAKDDSKPTSPPPSPPSSPPPRRLVAGAASPPFVAAASPPFAAAASPRRMPAIAALVTALTIVADAACPSTVIVSDKDQPLDELLGSHTRTPVHADTDPSPAPRRTTGSHARGSEANSRACERRA